MSAITTVTTIFARWIDTTAAASHVLLDRLAPQSRVQLIENEDATFTMHAERGRKLADLKDVRVRIAGGAIAETLPEPWPAFLRASRVQILLLPTHFLVRPLELPRRAAEFLDGIIRSQIDRLTPWSAQDAIYGWTAPQEMAADRIQVSIAAAARAAAAPLVRLVEGLGAASVVVSTTLADTHACINVLEQRVGVNQNARRVRTVIAAVFVVTGLAAIASATASVVIGGMLDDERQQLAQQIGQRRAALRIGQNRQGSAQSLLEQRKRETAASVVVLEALSKVLPDHTYVSELRIEGDKLQLIGITQDAPSLIGLLEQAPHFTRATFFAPTTRAANDPGERFHIEARLRPSFRAGS